MAGGRKPSSWHFGTVDLIDDGTLCRTQSPLPAPLGTASHHQPTTGLNPLITKAECLVEAYKRAVPLCPAAVYAETGYQLGNLFKSLIPGLLQMLVGLAASTALGTAGGAVLGFFAAGAGAAPGALIGGQIGFDVGMAILTWLGLGFLLQSIGNGLGEIKAVLWMGVDCAWHAADYRGTERSNQIEHSARALAKSVGILVRLLLEGIVAYLLKKAALASTRSAVGSAQAVRGVGAETAASEAVSGLVGKLRESRLGDGFATWVEQNWQGLIKNPRFRRIRSSTGAGGAVSQDAKTPASMPERRRSSPASSQPRTSDTTVIGHHPEYIRMANELQANRFEVPEAIWNKMTNAERWEANRQYLDAAMARSDKILLATPIENMRPGTYFEKELEYLYAQGYRLSEDGSMMIKKY